MNRPVQVGRALGALELLHRSVGELRSRDPLELAILESLRKVDLLLRWKRKRMGLLARRGNKGPDDLPGIVPDRAQPRISRDRETKSTDDMLLVLRFESQTESGAAWIGPQEKLIDQITEFHESIGGFEIASMQVNFGTVPADAAEPSVRLFGEKVIPRLSKL